MSAHRWLCGSASASCVERPGDHEAYGRCAYNFPRFRDPRMIWVTV
jgi:hypothetical protein